MQHLLDINQLTPHDITSLIQRALYFKQHQNYPCYTNHTLASLFYENSTRTRISFELAAHKLGISVINVDIARSSEGKGECIEDTIHTLAAMGIDLFAIRHPSNHLLEKLSKSSTHKTIHLINAGSGQQAHPTQALLDVMTIIEQKPNLHALKIAIIGDIRHSRVANSLQYLAKKMGLNQPILIAPKTWQPETIYYGQTTTSLRDGISDADIIICLRIQQERLQPNERLDLTQYHTDYAMTAKTLRWAKQDVMIMHPGPINRGIEIDTDIADGAHSYILQQVHNGVFLRMAVLEALIS